MLLTSKFQDVVNLAEGIFHRVVAIDSKIIVAMEIIGTNRFGLCLIYLEAFFDCFGTFSVVEKAARQGVNPATGAKIEIPAKKVAKFKAGKGLAL